MDLNTLLDLTKRAFKGSFSLIERAMGQYTPKEERGAEQEV